MLRILKYNIKNFSKISHYDVLGLKQNCSDEDIKKAFDIKTKEIMRDFNNDVLFDFEKNERLQKLIQSYAILSLENIRSQYDQYGDKYTMSKEKNYILNQTEENHRKIENQIRKKYSIDKFGRIAGGVPNKKTGLRGNAIGETGEIHDVEFQRELEGYYASTELNISKADEVEFAAYKIDDKENFTDRPVWFKADVTENLIDYNQLHFPLKVIKIFLACSIIFGYFFNKLKNVLFKRIVNNLPKDIKLGDTVKSHGFNIKVLENGAIKIV